jgi:cytochrome b561
MNDPIEPESYGPVAKWFHWAIVLLLAGQYAVAWTMPEIHRDTKPETLISLHLSLGALILLVMLLRLAWRLSHPVAPLTEGIPAWQVTAAQATHLSLYGLMLIMPVLGWANANARGWDVTLFGVFTLPSLVAEHSSIGHQAGDMHALLANVVLGLLGLHVAGALYHHFWLRDRTLARMSLR